MSDVVSIERVGGERIEEMEPLYKALHEHHAGMRPRLVGGPSRDGEESWRRRRESYRNWLAQPGAFALLARRDSEAVGWRGPPRSWPRTASSTTGCWCSRATTTRCASTSGRAWRPSSVRCWRGRPASPRPAAARASCR